MKNILFIILILTNTNCKFFDCKNLNDNNIIGKYKAHNVNKFLTLLKNKKYQYRDNDKYFEGEWLISNKLNCEICLKNWVSDSNSVIDFMYVVLGEDEIIFNYDNPSKNFYKLAQ